MMPPSDSQVRTRDAFGFKWARRETYESPQMRQAARQWLIERYCGGDERVLDGWLAGGSKRILDAGCGSGFSALLFFGERLRGHSYLGVDISDAADVARKRFQEAGVPGDFLKADLCSAPVPDASVDIAFSEGVLHHTDDTAAAFAVLAKKIKPGGRMLAYVYKKKAPVREFTDDHIRRELARLNDEDAWKALDSLTKLGESIGALNVEIDVPEDVPLLGIKKGRYPLQRFIYWNICKMYYRPEFNHEENHVVNFDWFRPINCHRHEPAEVEAWCRDQKLRIERLDVQDAGITVVAVKEAA